MGSALPGVANCQCNDGLKPGFQRYSGGSAPLGLAFCFGLVLGDRQPLHVRWRVAAFAFEGHFVIHLPARAGTPGLTSGRARVVLFKPHDLRCAALDFGKPQHWRQGDEACKQLVTNQFQAVFLWQWPPVNLVVPNPKIGTMRKHCCGY